MTEEEKPITWDDATASSNFVTLTTEEEKKLVLTNWKLTRRPMDNKIAPGKYEFIADCIEEDGDKVEKMFSTTSTRLKKKLQPIFEEADPTTKIKISVLRIGDQFSTQYSVKAL